MKYACKPILVGVTTLVSEILLLFVCVLNQLYNPLWWATLPQLANMEDNIRSDIKAEGFWCRQQHAYFNISVFNPITPLPIKRKSYLLCTGTMSSRREGSMRTESQTLSMAHSPLWFTTNWPISSLLCTIIFTIGPYFLFTVKLVCPTMFFPPLPPWLSIQF